MAKFKLIIATIIVSIFLVSCGKSDIEKKQEELTKKQQEQQSKELTKKQQTIYLVSNLNDLYSGYSINVAEISKVTDFSKKLDVLLSKFPESDIKLRNHFGEYVSILNDMLLLPDESLVKAASSKALNTLLDIFSDGHIGLSDEIKRNELKSRINKFKIDNEDISKYIENTYVVKLNINL